jgi:uncharacterized protein (DUF433 family)
MTTNPSMTGAASINWSQCPLVEVNSHILGGKPVVRGTQVPVSEIMHTFNSGVSVATLSTRFKIPRDHIRAILFYAKGQHRIRPE